MIEIGPYRFSEDDAKATLRHADDLFDVLVDDVDPEVAATALPYRARAIAGASRALREALPAYWCELRGAAAALREAGAYGDPVAGRVAQLNMSKGGVPKQPVDRVEVGFGGVVGDVQATRRHHGRPWQALCLWSAEVIDALAAEGHPIGYGFAGENITVADIPWERARPGVLLTVGTVRCEVVAFAIPCAQNAPWFLGGDFNTIHRRNGPISRIYALVIEPGEIATGDPVVVRPR